MSYNCINMKRETWTFQPTKVSESLVSKAVNRLARRKGLKSKKGLRSIILNEAIAIGLATLRGKREDAQ